MKKVIELFAGYGGASFALKEAGVEHETVAFSEIDKWAINVWEQNHTSRDGNLGDIKNVSFKQYEGEIDLITGGSPCQDFSMAGKRTGTHNADGTLTRSGLVYEFIRAVEETKTEHFIFENVGGTLTSKNSDGQLIIPMLEETFDNLGYNTATKVIYASDFGVPQTRPRVVMVGIKKTLNKTFEFPLFDGQGMRFADIIEPEVEDRYKLTNGQIKQLIHRAVKYTGYNIDETKTFEEQKAQLLSELRSKAKGYDENNLWACYSAWGNYLSCTTACTLTTSCANVVGIGGRVHVNLSTGDFRRITPTEAFRLMGLYDIKLEGISPTQTYKLAGNGWAVPPFTEIMKKLFEE